MKYLSGFILIVVFVSGCASTSVKNLAKNMEQPVKNSKVDFVLFPGEVKSDDDVFTSLDSGVITTLTSHCGLTFKQEDDSTIKLLTSPVWIPIITTIGKYIFDKAQNDKIKQLEALKKASQNSYSGKTFLKSGQLKQATCAMLIRYADDAEKADSGETTKRVNGFVAVLDIEHHDSDKAFSFTPIYVAAGNSTVITKKPSVVDGEDVPAKISAAIALSVKAIVEDENKLPSLAAIGAGSVSVSKIELSKEPKNKCEDKKCPQSDLIPHLSKDTVVSVSMSVTETGNTGIEFDALTAEITAIKEAFGPAIKESLTEYLSKDD